MKVRIESVVNVWDRQIPELLIHLVNSVLLTRSERELRTVIRHFSEHTDFSKFFFYGYGRNHFWLKQRPLPHACYHPDRILLIVEF